MGNEEAHIESQTMTMSTPPSSSTSPQAQARAPALAVTGGELSVRLTPAVAPFAGRVGGNQMTVVVDPNDPILHKVPDAAPVFSVRQGLGLAGFMDGRLYRFALVEGLGSMMLVFATAWVAAHPRPTSSSSTTETLPPSGIFGTSTFLAPLVGGFVNFITLTLFIYAFANVSGAQLNPTITFATFCARLITLPRLVLYVTAQTIGAALAGLMLARAYGTREFEVGGCAIDPDLVPVGDAFVLEFIYTLILLFLSFGVGLDPRQGDIIGATLSPWLVGLTLGSTSFGSAFTRAGYSGASMNPARCFGVFVGSSFPSYHWIHWVGPVVASMGHGIVYAIVPPWQQSRG